MSEKITVNGVEYVPAADAPATETQIVVAQRGWVFVGQVSFEGDDLVIRGAKNIRIWGTTRGLGELVNGPLPGTKFDEYGTVRIPAASVVARLDVTGGWE